MGELKDVIASGFAGMAIGGVIVLAIILCAVIPEIRRK